MELNEALGLIMKGIESTMSDHGFSAVIPEGTEKGAVPVAVKNGSSILTYTGKKGSVKIEFLEGKISLLCAQSQAAEAVDDDYKKVTMTLFNPDKADSKDIKYLVNDFCDGIIEVYGGKNKGSKKLPQPVSKAEAKSGAAYYDVNTLGSRFVVIYPELKEVYRANVTKYGEFLADDFFLNYGNAKVRETVQRNDPTQTEKTL